MTNTGFRIFAVAGKPVFQSKSPLLFNTAFRQLAVDAHYCRLAAASAADVMATAREIGMDGLNITAPFKAAILEHLDEVDEDARKTGAVNTVLRKGSSYIGYNTDIVGVTEAVRSGGFNPAGKKCVVLGAGGAARAAALALIQAGAGVVMMNRTAERASEAARTLGCDALPLDRAPEALRQAGLLVSAVSTSELLFDPGLLTPGIVVLDANYGSRSGLVAEATRAGSKLIDGKEWLLNQAIPSFELMVGLPAPVAEMRRALFKKRLDARRNIALVGFMGTGKSEVARKVAALTGMTLVDVDGRIEEKNGMTIADIFRRQGEEEFRRLEQAEMEELALDTDQVVACGGGAIMNRSNVRVLRNNCLSVWLWADLRTALARVGDVTTRPMLGSDKADEQAGTLLEKRLPFYAQTSDLLINTGNKEPGEIAERIWDEFGNAFGD